MMSVGQPLPLGLPDLAHSSNISADLPLALQPLSQVVLTAPPTTAVRLQFVQVASGRVQFIAVNL